MLKFVSKFTLDILPSVVATIIGAYIVNYYIIPKAGTNAPVAAAASTVLPKAEVKALEAPSEPVAVEAAPKAKAPVEKAVVEKAAVEKAPAEKNNDKSADKPMEAGSIPAENRRRPLASREKNVAKAAPATAPVTAAPTGASPAESSPTAEERRDANDLARAAIERLRASNEATAHAARAPEPTRATSAQPVQALPPAIMVSTPRSEPFNSTTSTQKPADADDSHRPPAEIPASRPIDLHAEATAPAPHRATVADEMLSAAKSVFQSVLPR